MSEVLFLNRFAARGRLLRGVAAALVVLVSWLAHPAWAAPTSATQAREVVEGWLSLDSAPMGKKLGDLVADVTPYADGSGQTIYYVVKLNLHGLVFVPADDEVEPIVAFTDGDQYDPSPTNPLGALVSRDIAGRIAAVQGAMTKSGKFMESVTEAQSKWRNLTELKNSSKQSKQGLESISDVWVSPLVETTWSQSTAGGVNTYNLYTPNNYVCGCVATAMAQLMRFHQHPTTGVGTASFPISVCGNATTRALRGGNGAGGPYSWSDMVLSPGAATTTTQRKAISALTADAGVSVNMNYCSNGSGTDTLLAANAFKNTFHYRNAIKGFKAGANLPATNRNDMVNPNLDAGYPVLLGVFNEDSGHSIVCDGYGYNKVLVLFSSLYHHLNMGWSGSGNVWYNLPTIEGTGYGYDTVMQCVYNIFPSGSGEIISGRVTDADGNPVHGATVTARLQGGLVNYTATTNKKGIYAFKNVPSNSSYTIWVAASGYTVMESAVSTGTSTDGSTTTGNKWGVDFKLGGTSSLRLPDTGITKCTCYDENCSEDLWGGNSCPSPGQRYYGQDANYRGRQPSYRSNGNGTVTDQVTGLMWQQADDGVTRTWDNAVGYCQDLELGGYTDWRMPSRQELLSIVDYGRYTPAINPVFSCSSQKYLRYWTASPSAYRSSYVWSVSFEGGHSYYYYKNITDRVRCVRGGHGSFGSFISGTVNILLQAIQ